VPGREAPLLVTSEMVQAMRAGSVVIDLPADSGGNVEGSVPGTAVQIGGAQVWGGSNVASQMPGPASRLYAQNIVNILTLMTGEDGFAPDFEDEIVSSTCVTRAGEITHAPTRELLETPPSLEGR